MNERIGRYVHLMYEQLIWNIEAVCRGYIWFTDAVLCAALIRQAV